MTNIDMMTETEGMADIEVRTHTERMTERMTDLMERVRLGVNNVNSG